MKNKDNREEKNAAAREWYRKVNYSKYKCRNQKIRRAKIREWFIRYKEQLKCKVCGQEHIAALDFHHTDPNKKDGEISNAINKGWSIKRLTEELNKCEVLCSCCHRILHYNINQATITKQEEIPELTNEEKPKYLGHHGNGIPKRPFEELNEYVVCETCKTVFAKPKRIIRRQLKRGCVKNYCCNECFYESLRKVKRGIVDNIK